MHESPALQKLIDRTEISDQLNRYCFFFDSNDVNGLRTLFTEDAEIDYGPEVPLLVGLDVIMASISKGLTSTFIATSHHLSNILIEFDDETHARTSSYVYAWHRYYAKSEIGYLWGQYSHTLRKEAGTWKIATLQLRAVATQNFHRETMHPVTRGN
jgi:hypothetical protein